MRLCVLTLLSPFPALSCRAHLKVSPQRVTQSDEYIGAFPVHVASAPPLTPVIAGPDSSPLPDRQALASAEKDLADTSTAVDELKSKLAAAEKRADVQRKRVEKKRAKLQRRLERERSKRVSPPLLSLPYPPPPFPSARRRRQLTLVESLAAVGPGGPSVQGQEARRQAG